MLKHIELNNFRNHKKFSLDLNNTSILIGKNASGKTSVLEAISLVSAGRSFRTDDKRNLINFDSDYCRVIVDNLEVYIEKNPRLLLQAKESGVKKKLSEFIGSLKSVVFSPETINIITGAPAERRRFLDMMISQNDKNYLKALSEYTKIRRQRNSLLELIKAGRARETELLFWDGELSNHGQIISKKRVEAIDFLNRFLPQLYQEISGQKKAVLALTYFNKSGDNLAKKLAENRAKEIAYGATIYGPHRDDLEFRLNNTNMQQFASRGELRSAILALKIGELKFLESESKNAAGAEEKSATPILLLDDIFSEFDSERREHLNRLILQYQSVITTTDKEHLTDEIFKKAKIIDLK